MAQTGRADHNQSDSRKVFFDPSQIQLIFFFAFTLLVADFIHRRIREDDGPHTAAEVCLRSWVCQLPPTWDGIARQEMLDREASLRTQSCGPIELVFQEWPEQCDQLPNQVIAWSLVVREWRRHMREQARMHSFRRGGSNVMSHRRIECVRSSTAQSKGNRQ
jgi:hypothetical protein